jgi:sialic acid synthase SpsE
MVNQKNVINFKKEPYIIAEIGINHNGYLALAKKLIIESKKAGADAVKFQKRDAEDLIGNLSKLGKSTGYLSKNENDIKHSLTKFGTWVYPDLRLELKDEDYFELKKLCRKLKIDFIVTPWEETSVDKLLKIGVKFLKIASIDANNYHFCEYVAKIKFPTIISTGMCTYEEILKTKKIFDKYKTPHIFLHCTSAYPSTEKDKNLKCIPKLRSLLNEEVGFSGHGTGIIGAVGATILGAKVIEKHVTLNKKMLGPDHAASLEFTTFKAMVENCRKAFLSLGSDQKSFLKSERALHNVLIRKFVARNNIKKGEKLNTSNIKTALIYSKKGILPKFYYQILNRKTKKAIDKGKTIFLKDLVK